MAANQNFTFYRLYGDFEGTGSVNGDDFTQLVGLLGTQTNASDSYADFDGNGVISGTDFTAFVTRLGTSISIPSLPSVVLLAAAPPVTTVPTITATSNAKSMASVANSALGDANAPSAIPAKISHQKPSSRRRH
jgi:hypothetical protein